MKNQFSLCFRYRSLISQQILKFVYFPLHSQSQFKEIVLLDYHILNETQYSFNIVYATWYLLFHWSFLLCKLWFPCIPYSPTNMFFRFVSSIPSPKDSGMSGIMESKKPFMEITCSTWVRRRTDPLQQAMNNSSPLLENIARNESVSNHHRNHL